MIDSYKIAYDDAMDISSTVKLNNGVEMPLLGLGTWKMDDAEAERAVRDALEIGYRHIDTAKFYGNEQGVGRAVAGSGIPRDEIFVTTKLWTTDFLAPEAAFERSLRRLGIDYVDLYLVHWPVPLMPRSVWRALEKIYEAKLVRAIGVSNYTIADMEKVFAYANTPPAVNQIQFSPFDYAKNVLKYCRSKNISITAYSPLTRGKKLHHPSIEALAAAYKKTPAQLLIRWALQHGTIVIPKASREEHIRENADVFDFEIGANGMQTLNGLT